VEAFVNESLVSLLRYIFVAISTLGLTAGTQAGIQISGVVLDLNGRPLAQAQVSLTTADSHAGADVITVFTGPGGNFSFPESISAVTATDLGLSARVLGYEQLTVSTKAADASDDAIDVTVIMRSTPNQATVAPASAWLTGINNRAEKAKFVLNCVGCHQVPSPPVRAYAAQIAAVDAADPRTVREQSWLSIVHYMNYLSGWEFGRANPAGPPDAEHAYSVGPGEELAATIAEYFTGAMDELSGYEYGAPLIVTKDTVIREYEVPGTNAIREAIMLGSPAKLWVADVSTNRVYAIDVATGDQKYLDVPFDGVSGPHSLHRAGDGSLWITPFFPSVIARLDPLESSWQTWPMVTRKGEILGIHDLSFGYKHELLADKDGLVWYSDIGNNAVGYFDPDNGDAEIFHTPEIPDRPGSGALLYGLIMTSDRKHIWYSQLGIGSFGNFNIETREFETRVTLPIVDAGPRRLTISDDDIMYVPLYGSGQLIEYDTKARQQIGIYDLPDTGSAPYAVTWDPVRKVVWIATSNADVIYRFDPKTRSFGVIPLPRAGAFLRMIDIDPESGVLVTSYANIVEFVHGPRMALIVDPGDGAYENVMTGQAR
jgi:streptogramin lyase